MLYRSPKNRQLKQVVALQFIALSVFVSQLLVV
jgi:hypothetical protein